MEIFILNDKFEVLAEIDSYTSLIWCRRAHSIGALDLEIEASTENVKRFQIGYFIYRKDTNDICRIDSIEVKTDAENGDSLIIGAVDLKSLAEQVTVLGEYKTEITNDGESTIVVKNEVNVEEWIREAMKVFTSNDSTVLPKSVYPQFQIDNFSLYNLKGYETKQVLLEEKDAKLSEHINYLCKMAGMSWEITYDYDTGLLNLNVVKGLNKTVNQDDNVRVLFSKTFDNLQSTKIAQSIGKMANVAVVHHNNASIVGDSGVVFAYLTREEPYGIYRFDISVDGTSVEIPHIQTDADFVEVPEGTGAYKKNDDGTFTKGKGNYDYHPQYTIDEIKSYREILKGLGLAKLRENRVSQNFESEINFNQFVYREDYDVGDVVTVQNDYGIQLDAKIIEVVETWDETGYSIEPAFEFIGAGGNFGGFAGFGNFENTENDWDATDCLITEANEPMMTETENFYLMYEAGITTLATEYGVALTSENDALITTFPSSLEPTAQVASMAAYGAEAVAATTYDVSTTSVDIETVKISELPEADSIGDACCLPIVQDGETKKIYFDKIKENIGIDENVVQTIVNNSISKVVANAPEDLDTLKEISDWISEHKEDASAMNSAILDIKASTVKKEDVYISDKSSSVLYDAIKFFGKDLNNYSILNVVVTDVQGNSAEYNFIFRYGNISFARTISEKGITLNAINVVGTLALSSYSIIKVKYVGNCDISIATGVVNGVVDRSYLSATETELNHARSEIAKKEDVYISDESASVLYNAIEFFGKDLNNYSILNVVATDVQGYSAEYNFIFRYRDISYAQVISENGITLNAINNFGTLALSSYSIIKVKYVGNCDSIATGVVNGVIDRHAMSVKQSQLDAFVTDRGVLFKNEANVMGSNGSIDFNTNKATIQIPIFSADATNQPTAQGAFWIQEVKESE